METVITASELPNYIKNTIIIESFYSTSYGGNTNPFNFPITILVGNNNDYIRTYVDAEYDSIQIVNVDENCFNDSILNPDDFSDKAYTQLKTITKHKTSDIIFTISGKEYHGYKELVKGIKGAHPNLDIKPDPFWINSVEFMISAGGTFIKDYFYHMHYNFTFNCINKDPELRKKFIGVYNISASNDVINILYKKYKKPVIKNPLAFKKTKSNKNDGKYFLLGKRVNEESSLFDDNNWNNVIHDIYNKFSSLKEYTILKLKTHIDEYKLLSDIIDISKANEDSVLTFKITEHNFYDIIKNNIQTQVFFLEDKNLHINIPLNKLNIYLDDTKINVNDDINFYIKVNENGIIEEFKVFNCPYGLYYISTFSDIYYQQTLNEFKYNINYKDLILEKFVVYLNNDLFKKIVELYNYE